MSFNHIHDPAAWKGGNRGRKLKREVKPSLKLPMCAIGLLHKMPLYFEMSLLKTCQTPRITELLYSVGIESSILVRGTMLPGRLSAGATQCEAPGVVDVLFPGVPPKPCLEQPLQRLSACSAQTVQAFARRDE